jgi:hypothetical protein
MAEATRHAALRTSGTYSNNVSGSRENGASSKGHRMLLDGAEGSFRLIP